MDDFKEISKPLGLKLNPLFTAIISAALKRTCDHYKFVEAKKVVVMSTMSMKPLPERPEQLNMSIYSPGGVYHA